MRIRRHRVLLPVLAAIVLAACALPAATPEPPRAPKPPPVMADPLPPERVPAPVVVDRSCRTNADCTIKDVGNCCGAFPACVNRASPTDPAAVQAQCARSGRMSVCGAPAIEACSCVKGACTDVRLRIDSPVQQEIKPPEDP